MLALYFTPFYFILYYNITAPENGERVRTRNISIKGDVEPNASIIIGNKDVALNPDGTFVYELQLEEGLNIINIYITDKAGNSAFISRNVIKTQDSQPQERVDILWISGIIISAILMATTIAILWKRRKK